MATQPSEQYRNTQQRFPELFDALEALGKASRHAGPLDEKSAQLIQLAAAAAARSEGAVHSHTRRALAAGADPAEIYHCLLLLVSTIGFPSVMAALSWAEDVFAE
ncbi:carboxymuconolactone decarboxylase family protein [Marinobacterium arenosum]|uniref:carboxymuconolactone decarboxylase family protein n=1 Tax=Marinobacterium arenosum TaxID=2862496 RepID=UPI001C94BE91|nr:carboxymuconolactone decarboxylase family protein [Marinobacterium arenosum]MBY4675078.1 carboxymuconolactone decarboxylase family protein [Marinobacterium arenosum]